LPVCLCILSLHQARHHGMRYLVGGLAAMLVLMAIVYTVPQSPVRERSEVAEQEVKDYFNSNKSDTSVGQRLEMWRTGASMIPGHLLLGIGKQGYLDSKLALIKAGKADPAIVGHTHLHNDYLDALVKRGIPGLLALLAVLLVPLVLFARRLAAAPAARPYAVAGVMVVTSYLLFGLTQAFFTHNNGVMTYGFLTTMLWSFVRNQEKPVPAAVLERGAVPQRDL
jgi:O-antigen ligase